MSKYVDHLPPYRQESIFARHGRPVSRTRLCDLVAACATRLEPVYRAMVTRLKKSFAIHADEQEILDEQLTGDAVAPRRRTRAGPILRTFGEWLAVEQRTGLPKSPFGQAVSYALNRWPTLGRYLDDARFTIDNNVAERAVRPLTVGRKNWPFVGGDGGLHSAGVLMSLRVSAKRHGLEPWAYLTGVLAYGATRDEATDARALAGRPRRTQVAHQFGVFRTRTGRLHLPALIYPFLKT